MDRDECLEELFEELESYSEAGSLDATRFLERLHNEGVLEPLDEDERLRFMGMRCMQGDFDECWRMYLARRKVCVPRTDCLMEDDFNRWRPLSYRRIRDGEYLVEYEPKDDWIRPLPDGLTYHSIIHFDAEDPLKLMLETDLERTGRLLRSLAEEGDPRAAYDLWMNGFDTGGLISLAENSPMAVMDRLKRYEHLQYVSYHDCLLSTESRNGSDDALPPEILEDMLSVRHDYPEMGFVLAAWHYVGWMVARDWDLALRYAVESAEDGFDEAADLVSCMVGHHHPTDGLRPPYISDEKLKEILDDSRSSLNDYGMMCLEQRPYSTPDRMSLQDGIEWRLITNLTSSDCYGFTFDKGHQNDSYGYEDDVMSIRPYDWGSDEFPERAARPNFLFKPTGFNMEWYKYPWRGGEMSENLSLGEIRRIWRLCIDHLITGRTFGPGSTADLLAVEPTVVHVPDDLRDRVVRVCGISDAAEIERISKTSDISVSGYRPDPDGWDQESVDAVIREISSRLGLSG